MTTSSRIETAIVGAHQGGLRLDKFAAVETGLSRSRVKALLDVGAVRVDGRVMRAPTHKVSTGERVEIDVPPPVDDTPAPEAIALSIVFEDDHLIVVDKPAGMTVHPAPGSPSGTLVNALLHHAVDSLSGIGGVMRPGIVHRIDKDTSGLLVVAKSDRAHRGLAEQFAAHTVAREYVLWVRGQPKARVGTFASRIARSKADRKKMAVVRGTWDDIHASDTGRHAITHFRVDQSFSQMPHASVGTGRFSRLICRLETGRTHQIRVHFAHIGCALLGDPLYGRQRSYDSSRNPDEMRVREVIGALKRQALHARSLGFVHPVTRAELQFEASLPPELVTLNTTLSSLINAS